MISEDIDLQPMAARLAGVTGVRAVVLGGSRARGTHQATSDVDLGIYYDPDRLDLDGLRRLAQEIAGQPVEVAAPGGWGPWVDGGAWLVLDGVHVDWILRDADRVREQCARARRGEFAFHAQPGHPLGFLDVSYAGEVATCRPLADPSGLVAELAASVTPYPPALARALVDNLWQAGFLVEAARKGALKQDVAHVQLCLATAAMVTAHAWHAVAGSWATNEKGLVPQVAGLGLDDGGFSGRIGQALSGVAGGAALAGAVEEVGAVLTDARQRIERLAGR